MATTESSGGGLDGFFKLSERGTNVNTEMRAGLATFLVMAYIIFVNPSILGEAGFDFGETLAVTCLVAAIGCLLFGLYANYPFAMAPGMGLNAVVAFGLILTAGLTPGEALGVIFMEGVLITVLVLTGLRSSVMNAVPLFLKHAIGVGIGLFILFIGLQNGGLIVDSPATLVAGGGFDSLAFLVFAVGLLLTILLVAMNVTGALLISIALTTVFAIIVNMLTGGTAIAEGANLSAVSFEFAFPAFSNIGLGFNFGVFAKLGPLSAILTIFSLMIADFFDTMGTLIGVGEQAGFLDEEGQYPEQDLTKLLVVDSLGAALGGLFGSGSSTTYIESSAGVAEGGRTGLTSVVVGVLFLLSIFLSPIAGLVPKQATAPALVLIGFFMLAGLKEIDFTKLEQGLPAMMTMMVMPLTYSITHGIGLGFITYVFVKVFQGKSNDVHPMMWGAAIAFLLFFLAPLLQTL